jgi:hypothetical protein
MLRTAVVFVVLVCMVACSEGDPTEPVGADASSVITVDVAPSTDNALLRTATWELVEERSELTITCTGEGETFEWSVTPEGTNGELYMAGLLPDTRYTCEALADDAPVTAFEFHTERLPDLVADYIGEAAGDSTGGYTILDVGTFCGDSAGAVVIVDSSGRVRWYQEVGEGPMDLVAVPATSGGLWMARHESQLRRVALEDQAVLWEGPDPAGDSTYFHHELREVPTGELLTLLDASNELPGLEPWDGFRVALIDPDTNEYTWTFDSQSAVEDGSLPPGQNDAYHANAASYVVDEDGPAIYVSLFHLGWIVRVDIASRAITWRLGAGGDFTLANGRWFTSQHAPTFDGNRVLVYANTTEDGTATRVVEYELDLAARTAREVWSWDDFPIAYGMFGSVDWLDTDRTFVASGFSLCNQMGTAPGSSSVQEIDRATGEVRWNLDLPQAASIYRATRVDECMLFPGGPSCR